MYIYIIYISTKTIEIPCLFRLNLLKSQRFKETLKNSFWSSTSIFWSSNSSNTQKYKEIQKKL